MKQNTQPDSAPSTRKGKHLNLTERQQIERWLQEGVPVREIAKRLDRNRSTIIRERRRGLVIHVDTKLKEHEVYSCERAQIAADTNKTVHGPSLKIGNNTNLAKQLVELLTGGGEEGLKCSPHVARQVLLRRGIDVPFSERTIYNYVYNNVLGVTAAQLVQGSRKKRGKSA